MYYPFKELFTELTQFSVTVIKTDNENLHNRPATDP